MRNPFLAGRNAFSFCHVQEIREIIGADSLGYLPKEELKNLTGSSYCDACFSGRYPTSVPKNTAKDRFESRLSQRKKKV